jgi:hypothetical protein
LELPQRVFSKRLRVFSTLVVALSYCVRNTGHLLVLVWFPCALNSACRTWLEWLIYEFPPRMPQWLIFNEFDPPTWLTSVLTAPLVAMAWAFVLSDICDRHSNRGVVAVLERRLDWIRFELSRPVLLGASILVVTDLLDGILHFAQLRLLVAVYRPLEDPDFIINMWASSAGVLRTIALSVVAAWTYPIAAQVLRMGKFDRAMFRMAMGGNRLRLCAIFFLLNVVLSLFDELVRPTAHWILQWLDDAPISWTLRNATIRRVIEFPFDVLWMVAWAVTTGIAMRALTSEPPSTELDRRATRAT